jgi:dephospho-CoA kinase
MSGTMRIVGLSGHAGSGKDTVARFLREDHGARCIALADLLKVFCKEIFGFSEEQLWGPSEMRNAVD